jgi:hypothetical protein
VLTARMDLGKPGQDRSLLLARTTSISCVMEVIYDSNVDIIPSSGTQCIPHGHPEPCRMVQAAPGTPAHTNSLRDTSMEHHMPEELTAMRKAESGHLPASAFIMQPSRAEDGEGSCSLDVTSTSGFSLKRNVSTIGLAHHPMVSTRC